MTNHQLPNSLWAATAIEAPHTFPLSQNINTDVAIVGAGFTGLRAALELSQAGVNVVVVDAGDIGWGASGRNGGQVNPIGHELPSTMQQHWSNQYGCEYTQRFTQLTAQSADALFALIKQHNIACDAEQNGWIRAAHGDKAQPQLEKMYHEWQEAGAELELLSQDQVEQLSGSQAYKIGWLAKQGGSVQPLSYARGLAHAARWQRLWEVFWRSVY